LEFAAAIVAKNRVKLLLNMLLVAAGRSRAAGTLTVDRCAGEAVSGLHRHRRRPQPA
jgi:hypothetical protein